MCWCVSVCVTRNLRRRKQTRQAVVEVHGDVMARKRRKMEKEVGGEGWGACVCRETVEWHRRERSLFYSFRSKFRFHQIRRQSGPRRKKKKSPSNVLKVPSNDSDCARTRPVQLPSGRSSARCPRVGSISEQSLNSNFLDFCEWRLDCGARDEAERNAADGRRPGRRRRLRRRRTRSSTWRSAPGRPATRSCCTAPPTRRNPPSTLAGPAESVENKETTENEARNRFKKCSFTSLRTIILSLPMMRYM